MMRTVRTADGRNWECEEVGQDGAPGFGRVSGRPLLSSSFLLCTCESGVIPVLAPLPFASVSDEYLAELIEEELPPELPSDIVAASVRQRRFEDEDQRKVLAWIPIPAAGDVPRPEFRVGRRRYLGHPYALGGDDPVRTFLMAPTEKLRSWLARATLVEGVER